MSTGSKGRKYKGRWSQHDPSLVTEAHHCSHVWLRNVIQILHMNPSIWLSIYRIALDINSVLHQSNVNNIKRSNIAHVTFEWWMCDQSEKYGAIIIWHWKSACYCYYLCYVSSTNMSWTCDCKLCRYLQITEQSISSHSGWQCECNGWMNVLSRFESL